MLAAVLYSGQKNGERRRWGSLGDIETKERKMSVAHLSFVDQRILERQLDPRTVRWPDESQVQDELDSPRERVRQALGALRGRERGIAILCHHSGLSVRKAAKRLGISIELAEHLELKARDRLRLLLFPGGRA